LTASERKIVTDAAQLAARLAELARPIVFTNGCFDILHRGHVAYLEEAAALGRSLVVGVNSDASVRRLEKGRGRPVNPLDDRMAILAALACVSLVVPFEEDTPLELIRRVRPDHLVKGGDWTPDNIVGADDVRSYGGQVHSIPFRFKRSTTELLQRIRSHA
jgi:rfaE bifunctional protein nucleotidyltransferase chain/domain